ncbi:conjugal transfer protein TraO [uncultured Coprobacter sp.]|uniref:conjugal transfer protein TraO n=1 Tax=uncultured Coprobacter sp. TaxID=1720550 RepID=UPI002598F3F1|nr:conjugal transfer protein TraO [uncultured Coprobacter sp.]
MKQFLVVIVALLALTGQANAQRCLPGMRGIEFKGGFVDGIEKPTNYYVGMGLSTYTKNGNRWVFGAEYLSKQYEYKEWSIPKAQFTAEGGYYLKFLSDASKTFFLSIGGSALAGYETSRWGDKLLPDGATLRNTDAFIYGGAVTLELETYLSDKMVLLLNARERTLWGSSIGHFHFTFGAGIKFIIN